MKDDSYDQSRDPWQGSALSGVQRVVLGLALTILLAAGCALLTGCGKAPDPAHPCAQAWPGREMCMTDRRGLCQSVLVIEVYPEASHTAKVQVRGYSEPVGVACAQLW